MPINSNMKPPVDRPATASTIFVSGVCQFCVVALRTQSIYFPPAVWSRWTACCNYRSKTLEVRQQGVGSHVLIKAVLFVRDDKNLSTPLSALKEHFYSWKPNTETISLDIKKKAEESCFFTRVIMNIMVLLKKIMKLPKKWKRPKSAKMKRCCYYIL